MKRWAMLVVGLAVLVAAAAAGAFGPEASRHPGAGGTPGVATTGPWVGQVEEDEPGWDCTTMGNRVCGPQVELAPAWICERPTPVIADRPWHLECGPRSSSGAMCTPAPPSEPVVSADPTWRCE